MAANDITLFYFPKEKQGEKKTLSEHCKEIKENKIMGKTTDVFKKIRDTKGTLMQIELDRGQKW